MRQLPGHQQHNQRGRQRRGQLPDYSDGRQRARSHRLAAGGYPQLSPEFIIKANPDYIILADTVCCHQSAATVAGRSGWSGLTAVKDGHVIALNDDVASRWGPRIIDLLRTVANAVASAPTN